MEGNVRLILCKELCLFGVAKDRNCARNLKAAVLVLYNGVLVYTACGSCGDDLHIFKLTGNSGGSRIFIYRDKRDNISVLKLTGKSCLKGVYGYADSHLAAVKRCKHIICIVGVSRQLRLCKNISGVKGAA